MNPYQKSDINDPGEAGTLQRIIYTGARASKTAEWDKLRLMIGSYHDKLGAQGHWETELSLLINALGAAVEEVIRCRRNSDKAIELLRDS